MGALTTHSSAGRRPEQTPETLGRFGSELD